MKMRGIAAACLAAAVLAIGGAALAGCGPDSEELVRQAVTEDLDLVKAHDAALLEKMAAEADVEGLAVYGVDPAAFLSAYLDGFDYRVDEVAVDGETARASVVLTCKSFDAFGAALDQAVTSLSAGEGVANMGEEETSQLVGKTLMDVLASVEAVEKAPVELKFTLKDKAWIPSSSVERAIADALFAAA